MSGKRSRRKGSRGELELAHLFEEHGFPCRRTPNSGGLAVKGDLTAPDGSPAIPGYHFEVKRAETLRVPEWLRQAHADAGELVPVVCFRSSRTAHIGPLGEWHSTLPTRDLLALLAELRDMRAKLEALEHGWRDDVFSWK